MTWQKFSGTTVDEALIDAMIKLNTTVDNLEYKVIEEGSKGFLGMFRKPAIIKTRIQVVPEELARDFLEKALVAMNIGSELKIELEEENSVIAIEILGEDMGVVIGKRGQTLDALQYLTSLVVNKQSDNYIKIKLDTENYRSRRKETLENLAKNIAYKVKRTKKAVKLEPMNPYERRIIHSALQKDKQIQTFSEGKDPYRKIVIDNKNSSRKKHTGQSSKKVKTK